MQTNPSTPRRHRRPDVVYRRRRAVAGSLVAGVLSLAGLGMADVLLGPGDVPASAAGAQPSSPRRSVVARPGDSLWSIAAAEYSSVGTDRSVSLGEYVDALVELNDGPRIEIGQRVLLP